MSTIQAIQHRSNALSSGRALTAPSTPRVGFVQVHHLNCGTMKPLIVGRLDAHVLLCESNDGLVLIDSGFGLDDIADPAHRLGVTRHLLHAALDPAEAAINQVRDLGFDPVHVRHIVLTHLDLDHVGGISDFPDALVHTTAAEHRAAMVSPRLREKQRYRPAQWSHGPRLQTYDGTREPWHGLPAAHEIIGVDGIALLPMPGHSRGHAAVAVDADEQGMFVHAGDAVFDAASIGSLGPDVARLPPRRALRVFEQAIATHRSQIAGNHRALIRMRTEHGATVFGAHDPRVF